MPERLGRYEIVERLSSGGMGEVFVARFIGPGGFIKPVALKRIHPHLASDENFIHMLHDEANVAAAIRHPNIVATIDVGSDEGDHFVVVEYVSGDPLSRVVRDMRRRNDRVPPWVAAWIGAQIASALHAAHEARALNGERLEIVHRDVSLANVMLSDAGHPMLFDFGVAKAKQRLVQTSHGELKGKLAYMAPETFRGAPVDRTVDVFALGIVLYELVTNISPFQRDSDLEIIFALQSAPIVRPSEVVASVDLELEGIILRAMARERSERYATAAEIERDLRAWAQRTGAKHDAAAVASWIAQTFVERQMARMALLSRVANPPARPAPSGAVPPSSRQAQGTPAAGYAGARTPSHGHAPTPSFGVTPPPAGAYAPTPSFGVTPPPAGGHAPTPGFGVTPPPASGVDPGGLARFTTDARLAQSSTVVAAPPRGTPWLGIAGAALAVGAIAAASIVLLSRSGGAPAAASPTESSASPSTTAATAAAPAPTSEAAPSPTTAPAPTPAALDDAPPAASAVAASSPTTKSPSRPRSPGSKAPTPASTPAGKGHGPLVRSYE